MVPTFVVRSEAEYKILKNVLSTKSKNTESKTSHGGWLLKSEDDKCPHLICALGDSFAVRQTLQSAERVLFPEFYLSCGVELEQKENFFIPKLCIRAVGRLEFTERPLLYEEILFDSVLQDELCHLLGIALPTLPLFSAADKIINQPEHQLWLRHHLSVPASDDFTSELLLTSKILKKPVSAIKVSSLKTLEELVLKFL